MRLAYKLLIDAPMIWLLPLDAKTGSKNWDLDVTKLGGICYVKMTMNAHHKNVFMENVPEHWKALCTIITLQFVLSAFDNKVQ